MIVYPMELSDDCSQGTNAPKTEQNLVVEKSSPVEIFRQRLDAIREQLERIGQRLREIERELREIGKRLEEIGKKLTELQKALALPFVCEALPEFKLPLLYTKNPNHFGSKDDMLFFVKEELFKKSIDKVMMDFWRPTYDSAGVAIQVMDRFISILEDDGQHNIEVKLHEKDPFLTYTQEKHYSLKSPDRHDSLEEAEKKLEALFKAAKDFYTDCLSKEKYGQQPHAKSSDARNLSVTIAQELKSVQNAKCQQKVDVDFIRRAQEARIPILDKHMRELDAKIIREIGGKPKREWSEELLEKLGFLKLQFDLCQIDIDAAKETMKQAERLKIHKGLM